MLVKYITFTGKRKAAAHIQTMLFQHDYQKKSIKTTVMENILMKNKYEDEKRSMQSKLECIETFTLAS